MADRSGGGVRARAELLISKNCKSERALREYGERGWSDTYNRITIVESGEPGLRVGGGRGQASDQ